MSETLRQQLRTTLRNARDKLDNNVALEHSNAICKRLATLIFDAQHIAGYYAFGKEVDLSSLMNNFKAHHKTGYVPVVLPEYQMLFAPVDADTAVTLNRYGIKEPQVDSKHHKPSSHLDAVLVPLVGFDEQCNRMGMGGGYYDRCFAHRQSSNNLPILIGVAYEMQCVGSVYAQDWDVPLDYVVTESRILCRANDID